jgi:hypothetical protein
MNDNIKEINEQKKITQQFKPLRHIKNMTSETNIGSAGQSDALRSLSKLSASAYSQSLEHSDSETSVNSEHVDTLADLHFQRKEKRAASNEILQEQTKNPRQDTSSYLEEGARFHNPVYLGIIGMSDTNISKNNEVSSKPLKDTGEYSQYQHEFSLAEKKAKKMIEDLQNLENTSLPNDIKAVIAKFRSSIYEACDTLEDYLDADQYSTEQSEAWKSLLQFSELTEIQGKSFIDCLKSYQMYLDDYNTIHENLVNSTIKGLKEQKTRAEGSQRQIIEFFIDKIRHEFKSINPDPIDTKLNLKTPINQITEEYHPKILKATLELDNFDNLISELDKEINNYIDDYEEYQNHRTIHEDLANNKIEELRKWQSHAKEKQKQRIEDFIGIIKQKFRKIKEDPIDIQPDTNTSIREIIEECNKKITEAFKDLNDFTPLATDSGDEFIAEIKNEFKDEIKLDKIKSLSINTVKREITQLKPQIGLFGDPELREFLPSLEMIEEYADNNFNDRYKDQMLKIHDDMNEHCLRQFPNKPNPTIKDIIHNIGFRQQQSETSHNSNDTSRSKEKEAGLDQQKERNRITHILNKLKSLQEGPSIKIITKGAEGMEQLKGHLTWRIKEDRELLARCRKTGPQIRSLRDQIVSHDITKPWAYATMEDLKEIETALTKERKNTNRFINALENQIKAFSDEFHTQQQE